MYNHKSHAANRVSPIQGGNKNILHKLECLHVIANSFQWMHGFILCVYLLLFVLIELHFPALWTLCLFTKTIILSLNFLRISFCVWPVECIVTCMNNWLNACVNCQCPQEWNWCKKFPFGKGRSCSCCTCVIICDIIAVCAQSILIWIWVISFINISYERFS